MRYVDASAPGGGDGTSWAAAFTSFQDALDAALPGDEVWVAAGTYPVPSNAGFVVPPEVSLYGGFRASPTTAARPTSASGTARSWTWVRTSASRWGPKVRRR